MLLENIYGVELQIIIGFIIVLIVFLTPLIYVEKMLIEITFDTRLTYDLTFTWMPHKTCSTKCLDGMNCLTCCSLICLLILFLVNR